MYRYLSCMILDRDDGWLVSGIYSHRHIITSRSAWARGGEQARALKLTGTYVLGGEPPPLVDNGIVIAKSYLQGAETSAGARQSTQRTAGGGHDGTAASGRGIFGKFIR